MDNKSDISSVCLSNKADEIITPRDHTTPTNFKISLKDSFYNKLNGVQSGLPAHDSKLVLGDFNARVGRETIH